MTHSRTMLGLVMILLCGCSAGEDPGREEVRVVEPWRHVHIDPTLLGHGRRIALPDGRIAEGRLFAVPAPGYGAEEPTEGEPEPPGDESCYAYVFPDAGAGNGRWLTPASFILDPKNESGLSATFVESRLTLAMQTWDDRVTASIFGPYATTGTVDGIDFTAPDGKNELYFGTLDLPYVAAAWLWWIPAEARVFEADVVFDDRDYAFGDSGPTSEAALGDARFFDLQNIAAHELGHAAGLQHPDPRCTQETMYPFIDRGETLKRTLHTGDLAGVTTLYR